MSAPMPEYGFGKFRPKCLQCCCTAKWALLWISLAGLTQGLMVNGFVNMSISTIEKRFGLKSRQLGYIISAYNISSFFCLVPVSYYGGRTDASKPKWLASGLIVMGIGSALFSIPHFLSSKYPVPDNMQSICLKKKIDICDHLHDKSAEPYAFWIFFLGQLLHGAGATPLFTLGVTYLDENIERTVSAMYFAIFYGVTSLGPALGFLIGSQFLRIYVDFLTVDVSQTNLTNRNEGWIGAWWIGFVMSFIFCLLLSIPLYGMPKNLPNFNLVMQTKVIETHKSTQIERSDTNIENNNNLLRQLPKHICDLLKNAPFLFLTFAGCCEGLLISAFTSFSPKELESQYSVSASKAVFLLGIIAIPAACGGILLGGYLTKRLHPSCTTLLKICSTTIIISCLLTTCLLIKCPNSKFAGVNVPYNWNKNNESEVVTSINLISDCNKHCDCGSTKYFPLCGIDNVIYYSPCHAGCQNQTHKNNLQFYWNCSCIDNLAHDCNCDYEAKNTKCEPTCNSLPYFLFVWFFVLLFTFLIAIPALSASLRIVHFQQRSLALGIQWILVRLCGTIPGPILFGTVIDLGCVLWEKTCDKIGSCLAYDNSFLSLYLWLISFFVKFISFIMATLSWCLYIPPNISQ